MWGCTDSTPACLRQPRPLMHLHCVKHTSFTPAPSRLSPTPDALPLKHAFPAAAETRNAMQHLEKWQLQEMPDDHQSCFAALSACHCCPCRALGRRVAPEDAPWSIAAGELQNMRQLLQLQPDGAACITNLDSFVGNNLTGPWLAGVNTGVMAPHSFCLTTCHRA